MNFIAAYLYNETLSNTKNEKKIDISITPSVNNVAGTKYSPIQTTAQCQPYHNEWHDSYNYWKQKTNQDMVEEETAYDGQQQWLQEQDIAVGQMWSRRYAETLPLCTRPMIEIKEPKIDSRVKTVPQKENTCIHGSVYVGTTCNCIKCATSNSFSFQLDMSEQQAASAIKKASGGRRNFRYNMWCTGRKFANVSEPNNFQDNETQVYITK